MVRARVYGPRSLTLTMIERPLSRLVTFAGILDNAEDCTPEEIATEIFEGIMVEQVRRILAYMPAAPPVFHNSRISNKTERSFLRHSGLAQADEISGFEQGTDLRHPPIPNGPHAGDARPTTFASQPTCFGEFGGSAFGLTF
jgi:hypothetical protein